MHNDESFSTFKRNKQGCGLYRLLPARPLAAPRSPAALCLIHLVLPIWSLHMIYHVVVLRVQLGELHWTFVLLTSFLINAHSVVSTVLHPHQYPR